MAGFQKREQELFLKIARDIKVYPEKYREAGKWLDQYYDYNELCTKKQKEVEQQKCRLVEEIEELEQKIKER